MRKEYYTIKFFFFNELCWGKALVAYATPQQWKKEENERQRPERPDVVYRSFIWKLASCKIQESKRKAGRSIDFIFLGWSMISKESWVVLSSFALCVYHPLSTFLHTEIRLQYESALSIRIYHVCTQVIVLFNTGPHFPRLACFNCPVYLKSFHHHSPMNTLLRFNQARRSVIFRLLIEANQAVLIHL